MRSTEKLLMGAATTCAVIVAWVVGSGLYAEYSARKTADTRRFLQQKLRYANGEEKKQAQEDLFKFVIATAKPPEASMALLDLIEQYPDVVKQNSRYSPERLLSEYPGTAGALLYQALALDKEGKFGAAANLLLKDQPFLSAPYAARCRQLTLIIRVLRQSAHAAPPEQAAEFYKKALAACDVLALETQVPSDIGMAHLYKAMALFERARQFQTIADADEAIRLCAQIKDIPGNKNPYLLNVGPQKFIEEIRKWKASSHP